MFAPRPGRARDFAIDFSHRPAGIVRAMLRAFAVAALLMLTPAAARAADCGKAAQSRAKASADEGGKAYKAGHLDAAADAFKKAYDACPSPGYLFNLGQLYRKLANNEQAVAYYKQYLAEAPDDDAHRDDAQKWIAQLDRPAPPPTPPPAPAPAATAPADSVVPPPAPAPEPVSQREPRTPYELGVRARYIFVTHAMLSPYFAANTGTQMNSWSTAIEFIYHRASYDVVTSVDFSAINVDSGNFLGSGHDPTLDTHYVQFRDVNFISADVSIIGHHRFLPWLELRYGGGLGIGWVSGDVLETNNGSLCSNTTAADTTKCFPGANPPPYAGLNTGPIQNGVLSPSQETQLQGSTQPDNGSDTNTSPHRHATNSKPPVMGVVNLLVGVRFYPVPRLFVNVEIGFRDAMFTGVGVGYRF
jgi:hypothetical protein